MVNRGCWSAAAAAAAAVSLPAAATAAARRPCPVAPPARPAQPGCPRSARPLPQVGISSVWWEGNPCNMHLNDLAAEVKAGVQDAGMVGLRFNTIGVSDGISMGTDGMSFSLQSRDLIAGGWAWGQACRADGGMQRAGDACSTASAQEA